MSRKDAALLVSRGLSILQLIYALTGSNYPPLPSDFHGPYLELRAYFLYNMEPRR